MMKYHNPRFLFRRYEVMRRVRKGRNFLEVGPGTLALAQELLTKFDVGDLIDFNTTDVEPIYDALDAKVRQRLKLIIGDFSVYQQFDSPYDCVVACEVLEHIQDDLAFLRKTHTLLAEGGQLILSVPARQKYWSTDDEIVGHYRRYEKPELTARLTEAGYSRISIAAYGFPFQNLVRLGRIAFARRQRQEREKWDKRQQSQQSAFLVNRAASMNLLGLILNKYTLYPLSLVASCFNGLDLAEGYVATAVKDASLAHAA